MADCTDCSRNSSRASGLDKTDESCGSQSPEFRPKSITFSEADIHSRMSGIRESFDDIALEVSKSHADVGGSEKDAMDISGTDTVELDSLQQVKKQQPVTSSETSSVDYVNRDPKNLQDFVKVDFADIIAEPEGSHSFNTIWGTSYKVFSVTKYWFYKIMALLFGIPCAIMWGVHFACLAFFSIWCITPCIKSFKIKMNFIGSIYSLLIQTFVDPVFESIGLLLSRIRIGFTLHRD
uniref:Caveolin n=1 Tax=Phallusia mammillata TaxID=59560 RepID=A0A6F9D8Y1_9ASCI|nr:caveolin-3 [Phallusia mammillata]